MDFHPIANVFPLMEGDEFKELVEDISANGQQQPIYLYEGKILDGRNRYRACVEAGEDPWVEKWSGDDALEAVKSLNLHRRHLTAGQKAAAATELEELYAKEARKRQGQRTDIVARMPQSSEVESSEVARMPQRDEGKARDRAAADLNVSPRYVSDAKKLKTEAPESYESVKRGEMSLPAAKREHEAKPKEPTVRDALEQAAAEGEEINLPSKKLPKGTQAGFKSVERYLELTRYDPKEVADAFDNRLDPTRIQDEMRRTEEVIAWHERYVEALKNKLGLRAVKER